MTCVIERASALLFCFGLVACGASTPVRDHVARGEWAEACLATARQEIGDGANDMDGYDVASEVAKRSPARVQVRAWAAPEVEKKMGLLSGSTLRFPPFDSRPLGVMLSMDPSPPDDLFEREWLVIEISVEVDKASVARVHIGALELEVRQRARPDPDKLSLLRFSESSTWKAWTPSVGVQRTPPEDLAKAMGLLREPGTGGMTGWSMLDLAGLLVTAGTIDFKTRGADSLLPAKPSEGRQPSVEEMAAMKELYKLVGSTNCGDIAPGASCVERILLRKLTSARVNSLQLQVSFVVGSGATQCRLADLYHVPLPPGRTMRAQLDPVFGAKGKMLGELDAMATTFWNSADPCEGSAASCPPRKDCLADVACSFEGRCELQEGACVARAVDCESTAECYSYGKCAVQGGACAAPAGVASGCERECAWTGECEKLGTMCVARTAEHCASSFNCKRFGACQLDRGVACAAVTNADCARSEVCRERGFCTLKEQKCVAETDEDCASAAICKTYGACRASGGMCVTVSR